MSEKPRITVVIPVLNEEKQIADCIASVKGFASEVIIVDDGCTDRTVEIATGLGARRIPGREPDDPNETYYKIGYTAATGDWILGIDADERMVPSLAERLLQVAKEGKYDGVMFARKNMIFGKWIRYGGWFKNDQMRFFRATAWDREWDCIIHSTVPVKGEILTLPLEERFSTIHLDYDTVDEFVERTLHRYALREAREGYACGKRASICKALLRPVKRIMGRYFLRQGFRDGVHGLLLALLLGAYDFCIEANLWDIQRQENS